MNISQLPYIVAIASTGSLSAAARQLGISQPALSKFLKNTEKDVGQELFFRSQNRYFPTPAGQIYLSTAQQILNLDNHTRAAVSAMNIREQVAIRVGISPNRGVNVLSAIYPEFEQRFPDVQLTTFEGFAGPMLEQLLAGNVDMIFTTHVGPMPEELQFIPTQQEELVLAVPSFHPLVEHHTFLMAELPFADLRDFRDCTFASPGPQTTMYGLIMDLFKATGITPKVSATVPNLVLQEAMIRSGTKVGILPAYYVRPNPDIAFFRLRNSPILTCYCAFRRGNPLNEAQEFLMFLFFRQVLHTPNGVPVWSDDTRRLMLKYDPLEAAAFGLEETV